jgi:histidinol-phosphate aminotransferase
MGAEDEAVITRGSFIMYKVSLQAHGRRFIEVPMKEGRNDLEAIAAAVGPRTRIVIVANPDNPTGTWFGRSAFEQFLEQVKKANPETIVVMDEAYFEYATAEDYPDSLPYHKDYPTLVTLRTFSKIYGLAAVRLGYGVMHPTLAGYLNRTRSPFNISSLAQVAGMAALEDKEFIQKARELNAAQRERLTAELTGLGLSVLPSQTNFLLADLGKPAAPVYEQLLRRGVIVRPVPNYGLPNSLRITVGTGEENDRLVAALKEALQS